MYFDRGQLAVSFTVTLIAHVDPESFNFSLR